jgi:hypothetical protein
MEEFYPWDDEKPIEEYPGYIGMTWDGEFYPGPELEMFEGFDWSTYWDLIDQHGERRRVSLPDLPYVVECLIEAYSDLAFLFDQMPSIQVKYDKGPPDAGPASGEGFVFFIADGISIERLNAELLALKKSLDLDLQHLSADASGSG